MEDKVERGTEPNIEQPAPISVLLVEDNAGDARLAQEALLEEGTDQFVLVQAQCLSEALGYLDEGNFDVVLLDLSLPDSRGLETFSSIQRKAPGVAVVVLTGIRDEQMAIKAVRDGAQDYLVKGAVENRLLARALRYAIERNQMERALRESEDKMRVTFESIGDGIVVTDMEGRITEVNEAEERMSGYSKDEIVGQLGLEFIAKKDRTRTAKDIVKALQVGHGAQRVYTFVAKDGREYEGEALASLLHDGEGNPIGIVSVIRDITERTRMQKALQRRNRDLAAMNTIAQALSRPMKLSKVLQTALDNTLETMGLPAGTIFLMSEDGKELVLATFAGFSRDVLEGIKVLPVSTSISGKAAETGKVIVTTNLLGDKRIQPKHKTAAMTEKVQTLISVPLMSKGKALGVMNIGAREVKELPKGDIQLLETIGGEIGVAIENVQLVEKLSELSTTDELTGLHNRRRFYEMLESELHRTSRDGLSFSVVMLDLDGFKKYNDRFGHTNGDEALKAFANTMRSASRKTDTAFRYGGDEFTIILPATNADWARKIIERIRAEWLQLSESNYPTMETPLGFSAGIAQFPENAETADGLVFLSDTALYHAKREGGYRSTLASEMGTLSPELLSKATLDQVYVLASTVDGKDPFTYGHSKRVADMAKTIGRAIGLGEKELADLYTAALLHDIGKVGVPDSILTNSSPLTDEEWAHIKGHCIEGSRIVGYVKELSALVPIIRHHHEWYDGSGYPDGLKNEQIPLGARVISVADAYDTMTTPRPYRETTAHNEALAELKRYSGSQFDPDLVKAFRRAIAEYQLPD